MSPIDDVGGWRTDPTAGAAWVIVPFEDDPDLTHVARTGHPRTPWGMRNGLPETSLYTYRPGEAEREAEVAARIAEARRRAVELRDREAQRLQEIRSEAAGS